MALKADRHSQGERTPTRLLEASLRMRPDRIILGELRGEESRTFLEAINTGHGGSFTTVHADTARKAIDRLAIMVMAAGLGMGFEEVKRYCEGSVDLVVQLERRGEVRGGGNYVRLSETTGSSVGIRIHPLQPPVLFFLWPSSG